MSSQGPPGLQYPSLPSGVDPKLEAAIRNVFDNLFYIRRQLDRPSIINTPAARAEIQRLITSQVNTTISNITNITQNVTACIVGSHNLRLTAYGTATNPTGTFFYEIDRHVLYVINPFPNNHWEFVAGVMVALLADQPADLGSNDVGFLFYATDASTLYIWDDAAWQPISGSSTVVVDPYGALDGDGTIGDPLAVRVDNATVFINASNNLTSIAIVGAYCALDGDGSVANPLCVNVDGVTVTINAYNQLEAVFGSGGNTTSATAFGSEPGSPNTGDLDLYTNAPQIARYTGALWQPYGPIWAFTAPISGDYAWINQDGATVDTTYGGVLLYRAAASGDSWHIRKKAQPSLPTTTPYYIVIGWIPHLYNTNHNRIGFCWRQSSDGKLIGITMKGGTWQSTRMNSPTSFNSESTFSLASEFWQFNIVWVQIADDGTNRKAWLSHDGFLWHEKYSETRSTFMTADEVGFYVDPNNGSGASVGMHLLSWAEYTSFQGINL